MALITTTKGLMPTEALRKRETRTLVFERLDDGEEIHTETATAVEYRERDDDTIIHRSADVVVHQVPQEMRSILTAIGG